MILRQQRYYWCSFFLDIESEILNKLSCLQVYLNALGLLLRLYVRGEIDPAKERLTTLLDELKNEVLSQTGNTFDVH